MGSLEGEGVEKATSLDIGRCVMVRTGLVTEQTASGWPASRPPAPEQRRRSGLGVSWAGVSVKPELSPSKPESDGDGQRHSWRRRLEHHGGIAAGDVAARAAGSPTRTDQLRQPPVSSLQDGHDSTSFELNQLTLRKF